MAQPVRTDYFYKLNLGVEHLTDLLICILHNQLDGLPKNGRSLYQLMIIFIQHIPKNAKRFFGKDQLELLCPTDGSQTSDSTKWDVTLISAVIRNWPHNVPQLQNHLQPTQQQNQVIGDICKARNNVKHKRLCDLQLQAQFDPIWQKIRIILVNGNYQNLADFDALGSGTLLDTNNITKVLKAFQEQYEVDFLDLEIDMINFKQNVEKRICNTEGRICSIEGRISVVENEKEEMKKRQKIMEDKFDVVQKSKEINSTDADFEDPQEFEFELEKNHEGGCLLSFFNVELDISTHEIELTLCRNEDKKKKPLVKSKEYEIEKNGHVLYVHIQNCLQSGYKYSFQMKTKTAGGMDVKIVYKDLLAIDERDCRYVGKKDGIIILAHNNGVPDNIHFFKISNDMIITDDTPCKPILKGPVAAETFGKFGELSQEYFNDNNLTRFPSKHYVQDQYLRSFGNLLESFLHSSRNSFFRILSGYDPISHLKMFGYTEKKLQDIGKNEQKSIPNSVIVVDFRKSLIFVGVVLTQNDNSTKHGHPSNNNDTSIKATSSTKKDDSTKYGGSTTDGDCTRDGESTKNSDSTTDGDSINVSDPTTDGNSTKDDDSKNDGDSTTDGDSTKDGHSTKDGISITNADMKKTIQQCNLMLKAIYVLNKADLKDTFIAVVGAVVLPNICRKQLTKDNFKSLNAGAKNMDEEGILFVTKEDLQSPQNLEKWWKKVLYQIKKERRPCINDDKPDSIPLKRIAGQMMGSMAMVNLRLPRLTKNLTDKICTVMLNVDQWEAIHDESPSKLLVGPFGSGKSLVLKEIAQMLFEREESGIVYYICFDPYSLLEIEIAEFFNELQTKTDSLKLQLTSLSIEAAANQTNIPLDHIYDVCGVPSKNIADLLVQLAEKCSPLKAHFLIDEFHAYSLDEAYCRTLEKCLQNQLKDSTVVVASQSVNKMRTIYTNGAKHEIKSYKLENSKMKVIKLSKCMRMAKNLYDLIQKAQECIEGKTTSLVLQVKPAEQKPNPWNMNLEQSHKTGDMANEMLNHNENDMQQETAKDEKLMDNNISIEEKKTHDEKDHVEKVETKELDHSQFQEPELISSQFSPLVPTAEEEVAKELQTKVKFQKGECGITFKSSDQPQLIYLDNSFSLTKVLSGQLLALVIEKNYHPNQKTTIICNSLEEIYLTKFALDCNKKISFKQYTPYLLNKLPSTDEKKEVWTAVSEDNCVLLTDYRGFRGCETDHCVCFVSPNEQYVNHVLVEILSRAVAKIDILILPEPQIKKTDGTLAEVIQSWETAKLIKKSIVKLESKSCGWTVSLNGEESEISVLPEDHQRFHDMKESLQVIKDPDAARRHVNKATDGLMENERVNAVGAIGDSQSALSNQSPKSTNDNEKLKEGTFGTSASHSELENPSNPPQNVDCAYSDFGCTEKITNIELNEHLLASINEHGNLFRKSKKSIKNKSSRHARPLNKLERRKFDEMQKLEKNVKSLKVTRDKLTLYKTTKEDEVNTDTFKKARNQLEQEMLSQTRKLEKNIKLLQETKTNERSVEKCVEKLFEENVYDYGRLFKELLYLMESDKGYLIHHSYYYKIKLNNSWQKKRLFVFVVDGRKFDYLKTRSAYHNNNVCVYVDDDVSIYLLAEEGWTDRNTSCYILHPKLHKKVYRDYVRKGKYRDYLVDEFVLLQVRRR